MKKHGNECFLKFVIATTFKQSHQLLKLVQMLFCDLFSLFLVAYSDSDELAVLLFNVRFACAFGQEHANVQVGADNGAVIGLKTVRVRVLVFCHLVVFLLIF